MELNDKEKKILELLKKEESLATTKIAFLISSNLYQTEVYLEQLYKSKKIIKNKKNNATYWGINNGQAR